MVRKIIHNYFQARLNSKVDMKEWIREFSHIEVSINEIKQSKKTSSGGLIGSMTQMTESNFEFPDDMFKMASDFSTGWCVEIYSFIRIISCSWITIAKT